MKFKSGCNLTNANALDFITLCFYYKSEGFWRYLRESELIANEKDDNHGSKQVFWLPVDQLCTLHSSFFLFYSYNCLPFRVFIFIFHVRFIVYV